MPRKGANDGVMRDKQLRVLKCLQDGVFRGPTEIGLKEFGYGYNNASSKLTSTMKTLAKHGYVERSDNGRYRITHKGLGAYLANA